MDGSSASAKQGLASGELKLEFRRNKSAGVVHSNQAWMEDVFVGGIHIESNPSPSIRYMTHKASNDLLSLYRAALVEDGLQDSAVVSEADHGHKTAVEKWIESELCEDDYGEFEEIDINGPDDDKIDDVSTDPSAVVLPRDQRCESRGNHVYETKLKIRAKKFEKLAKYQKQRQYYMMKPSWCSAYPSKYTCKRVLVSEMARKKRR